MRHSILLSVCLVGCLGQSPPTTTTTTTTTTTSDTVGGNTDPGSSGTSAGTQLTFDHQMDAVDPFAVLRRITEEGPPEISTRMHACGKIKVATLGRLLEQLGVDLTKTATPASAGQLYLGGLGALGAANYGARVPEALELTAAGAAKLFDIFVEAAPEVIAAMPTLARCEGVGATPTQMFDSAGHCTFDGISCLVGVPATQAQKDLCDAVAGSGTTPTNGKTLAVATILSAAHTCE